MPDIFMANVQEKTHIVNNWVVSNRLGRFKNWFKNKLIQHGILVQEPERIGFPVWRITEGQQAALTSNVLRKHALDIEMMRGKAGNLIAIIGPDQLTDLQMEAAHDTFSYNTTFRYGENGRMYSENIRIIYLPWVNGIVLMPESYLQ